MSLTFGISCIYVNYNFLSRLQANVETDEESNSINIPIRSSLALDLEAPEKDEKTSGFDISFEDDTVNNLYENISDFSSKTAKDPALNTNKPLSMISGNYKILCLLKCFLFKYEIIISHI